MRDQPAKVMAQAEFNRLVGEPTITPTLANALIRAREVFGQRHDVVLP
jgi:hypothetical protein